MLVETGSSAGPQQIRPIRAMSALVDSDLALPRRGGRVLAVARVPHAVDARALDPQALRVDGLALRRGRRLEQRRRDGAELAGLRAPLDKHARARVRGPDAAREAHALAALRR